MEDARKGARGAQWAKHSNTHLRGSVGTGEPVRCCSGERAVCVLSHVRLLVTPWTVARQAPLSVEFYRQEEYWRGLLIPPPGYLPDPGIKPLFPVTPALAGGFFTTSAPWEALGGRGGVLK